MEDIVSVTLDEENAALLKEELKAAGLECHEIPARSLTGEQLLVAIICPVTIGALQIMATFISARIQPRKKVSKATSLSIKINDTVISADGLSVPAVERLIGKTIETSDQES